MKMRFSDWRDYCCLLYRDEYKYSGFAKGKNWEIRGGFREWIWGILVNRWLENQSYFPHPEIYLFAKLP